MIGKTSTGGRAVFRHVDYSRYLFSRFLWGLGLQIQTIAIAWYVYDVTNDPLSLGLIGLAAFIPAVPLSLLTGPAADRYDRRVIMLICCTILALCSAALIALQFTGNIRADQVWPVYVVIFVLGIARSFANPAGQALVMTLVPDEEFASAAADDTSSPLGADSRADMGSVCLPSGRREKTATARIPLPPPKKLKKQKLKK